LRQDRSGKERRETRDKLQGREDGQTTKRGSGRPQKRKSVLRRKRGERGLEDGKKSLQARGRLQKEKNVCGCGKNASKGGKGKKCKKVRKEDVGNEQAWGEKEKK